MSELIEERLGLQPAMEINPDEAVALGAAVQAAIIRGEQVDAMLIDVAPHSLGIAVADVVFQQLVPGMFRPIIRRNTTIPATRAELFHTLSPKQDTVEIEVYQGESPIAKENTHLTSFKLTEIPPAPNPSECREVIVEFSYNLNGIVEVTARDHAGGRREMATVNVAAGKRAAYERETKAHFDPTLERDVKRSLDAAVKLELQLEADGKTKEAKRLRDARRALEEAHAGENEKRVMDKLNELDDALYDLEQ